ncbi:XdhC family protein [Psychrobacter aquaticus]|uniref:Xanthine and CO dehydrogenase maturation factor, XdhC/CoxF family n=1 Tax=Psychrobacter aquaticus CMS 56 TaxID=1354303 RepID=U4T5R0_9GAMM|nr:XdhC/CoxI family protein [Psychrobacter aquaticus]ERL56712.1 Xanthine and CO dehydrogenase maturation factor, XdhC/CoxF family [Psychrobacter aquaticus CMS 56]
MNQVADILKLASEAQQKNVDAVLATVVRTEGSAYRRAGAMMLICEDGCSVGMISGGCLEPHIIKRAFWLTRNGANVQVYQTGDDVEYAENGQAQVAVKKDQADIERSDELDFEPDIEINIEPNTDLGTELDELNFGLGCNGRVHVLFERVVTAKPLLEIICQVRYTQQPATIATLIRSDSYQQQSTESQKSAELQIGIRINLDDYSQLGKIGVIGAGKDLDLAPSEFWQKLTNMSAALLKYEPLDNDAKYVVLDDGDGTTEWLIQRLQPQTRLLICGAGNDVMPLVTMAKLQDWHVTVIDSRAQYATRMRFPQADMVMHLPLESTEKLLNLSNNAAVALMSHSLSQDRARLAVLLAHPKNYRYIGQLGPRYRTERLINEISTTVSHPTVLDAGISKLHYPIGYKLGGDGPEALALGIMAQINAVMHEQTASNAFLHNNVASTAATSNEKDMAPSSV